VGEDATEEVSRVFGDPVLRRRLVEDVSPLLPRREVQVVTGRSSALDRPADERGHEAVHRGGLLDRELQQEGLVGGRERLAEARIDLPLGRVVFVVGTHEREAESTDVLLHRAQHAVGVHPGVETVGEARGRLVALQAARLPATEEKELELVADGEPQATGLGSAERPPQHAPRVGLQRLPVQEAIPDADRGALLPRQPAKGRQVRPHLHVAEVDLVPEARPVGHRTGVIDREDGHAEVQPPAGRLLEQLERDQLRAGRPVVVGIVDPNAGDTVPRELTHVCRHRRSAAQYDRSAGAGARGPTYAGEPRGGW
jgi:hypothetical protein